MPDKWGIDLSGKRMRYTPWPLENGKYRQPDEKEIEEIYGISGEAVRETLLYFEECRGNTAELVEMLNSHIIDNTYTVTREDLLDNKRRYNNEYYFYFQMFCKKIIGRYNWHFGEGSNEQLSEYHKIWEKGIMDNEPWGIDKKNRYINDYASLNLSMYYDFYIRQNEEKSQLFFEFFNKILPDGFITDHDFFQNENFSVSCELIYYGYEFVKIILNINHIAREYAANYSISNKKVIAVMLIAYTGMFSHKIPMIALQKIINKANNVYFIASDISKKTLKYSYQLRNDFDQKKFYIYKKSCIRLSIINALDLLPKVIQTLFKMPRLPVYKSKRFFFETAYPYAECEMEIARISFFNKKDILIALTASIAVSLISFFSLQQLNNLFFYHFVVLFLIFSFILNIAYLKRNNSYLKKNTLEHDFLAESQYQVLIKTSAELLKERNLLEQKVNQRTGELSIANKRLQQLDRLKSDFFANISHELRTPLTLIMTPLETLLKSGGFSVKQKGILSAILLNCSKLGTMINNLLDFSRIEAKKLTINNKPAPICRLLEEYAAQVRPAMESRGIKFIYQNRLPKTFLALVDTGLLEKAVFNLLSNALKFTPAGGKTELILSADRECFFITVKDSGIGIPAEKLEIIFDRFSQADTSSSRKYEGAGIGLYLAREIAILHGGDISVKSRPNEGSEFIIRLPIGDLGAEKSQFFNKTEKNGNDNINKKLWMSINSAQKKETRLIRTEKTDASGHKNNILIVEDNPELRNYLDELLRKKYTIHKAANGREALDIIASAKIDLALADIMMPEMDGFEMLRSLRSNEKYNGMPVIFLTARADIADRLRAFNRGVQDYIVKPFHAEELCARLVVHLKMAELYRQIHLESSGTKKNLTETTRIKMEKIKLYLEKNYLEEVNRNFLAKSAGLSPDHLGRMFFKYTGRKISDFVCSKRLSAAAKMIINTDKKILDIAFEAGFNSLSSFNNHFIKQYKVPPIRYRHEK